MHTKCKVTYVSFQLPVSCWANAGGFPSISWALIWLERRATAWQEKTISTKTRLNRLLPKKRHKKVRGRKTVGGTIRHSARSFTSEFRRFDAISTPAYHIGHVPDHATEANHLLPHGRASWFWTRSKSAAANGAKSKLNVYRNLDETKQPPDEQK